MCIRDRLSGDYCRVHLGILQDGLSAETFARLFALSAWHEECGREKLEAMLTALQTMADAGELPFSAQETAEAVERWRRDCLLYTSYIVSKPTITPPRSA